MKTEVYLRSWHAERAVLVEKTTFESETFYIEKNLIPNFPGVLNEITPQRIQDYMISDMCKYSHSSVKKHLSVLRHALDDAVVRGYLAGNPARYVKIPRQREEAERTVFLTAMQAQSLLDGLALTRKHDLFLAVALALFYGLRRSEVLGLRWESVNWDKNTFRVEYTVVKAATIVEKNRMKTSGSRREYELIPEVRALLEKAYNLRNKDSVYVFSRNDGSVMRPDSLTRTFQRSLRRMGFPLMRFHDLRHSSASILFDNGWGLQDVKEWLGHTDIETTSNIYLHYNQQRKVLVGKNLSGMLTIPYSMIDTSRIE